MPSPYPGGAHELGQNFLVDRAVITEIGRLVARTTGPVIEIGPGAGAVTLSIGRAGREITAVEIDPRLARRLRHRAPGNVEVVNEDVLRYRFPRSPHVIVGNLPFHLTTGILKRILTTNHWHTAILLVQWEVARRRAGVGGASMLTASWWPWYEFSVHSRVPARAFRPMPSVDGGLLTMTRRREPLVSEREDYQRFVKTVFTGRGHGIREILRKTGALEPRVLNGWLAANQVSPRALPKDLDAVQWAALWRLTS
ncbi:23S ribosomal RNA methyltransferase Erm [Amycolatopsis sp. NPDC059021]|uniref:23S ribosomal RNA methyltransferase Erm n=1 Tax=Amycolatopsis sp. NPDC059021 TaxID=3346704 RepID=UPI003670181D